ncbi:MAG: AmmeMemoRadiSam system protein B [Burkholderiales bacterium]|nr:AmmeMemoRadiSam system protein B [Burkholderiales bacterium]
MRGAAIRAAAVAGVFYPADPAALAGVVQACLRDARAAGGPAQPTQPKVLLVPHAGFVYSGPIAGSAYALLAPWRERLRRVVLLGPTHRVAVRGLAASTARGFETPLGVVPVDRVGLDAIADLPQVGPSDAAHAEEHSLEVQLPFLQCTLDRFTLVPLAVGRATPEEVAEVLERLWGGDETLIVISSDLSHYLPYAQAQARDRATIERVLRLDPELHHHEACGATPLAGALLAARRHGLVARLLDLRNSGDTAGDTRRVVGYGAVAFEGQAGREVEREAERGERRDDEAGADLGQALLVRARNAIAAPLGLATQPEPAHPALAEDGTTFVTLHHAGALRGCIGDLRARRSLDEDVRAHAAAAAFADPRFAPLAREEFEELRIEVSVLGAAEPLAVASEAEARHALRRGVDGVILEWRGRRATFLPQVWQQLPHAAGLLNALKLKAGLPPDFWAEDLRLARYEVRKFAEAAERAESAGSNERAESNESAEVVEA